MSILSTVGAAVRSHYQICIRPFAARTISDAAVNKTIVTRVLEVECTWDAGLSLLPLEVKALRAHLCDISAAAVSCTTTSRATLSGVSFPGWAVQSDSFGIKQLFDSHSMTHGSSKREVPLLLKRQQLRKLFAAASSSSLQLHCTKIYFNEGGWAKARIVAARKELPPDKRRDTAERQLRRRDDHDE
jgi:tmRNA-binding protein